MLRTIILSFALTAAAFFSNYSYAQQAACKKVFIQQDGDAIVIQDKPLNELQNFRVMSFNVENLFTHVGEFIRKDGFNLDGPLQEANKQPRGKSPQKIAEVGNVIKEISPHFGILTEVESLETLQGFVKDHLRDNYDSFLIPGNDPRGIQIGLIARKSLQVKIETLTNKDRRWTDPTNHEQRPLFSRDLPVWIVRTEGAEKPALIILGMHAKSKRDRQGDPESQIWRTEQLKAAVQIIKEIQKKFGEDVPVVLGGDFNTDVRTAPEAEILRKQLLDSFEISARGPPRDQRATHTFHPENGPTQFQQLDGLFVTQPLTKKIITAQVYRYKDTNGNPKPLPTFFKQREENPSDHFPIFIDIAR